MSELKAMMTRAPRRTLAVAESLTSGRIQARIGSISGASEFFLGGVTAYSLQQKVVLLGVDRAGAEAVNCVSASVAEQMARGACVLFGADIGLATTGYAEPASALGVYVPFAWWAAARRLPGGDFEVIRAKAEFPGLSRIDVQEHVAKLALDSLEDWLRGTAAPQTP